MNASLPASRLSTAALPRRVATGRVLMAGSVVCMADSKPIQRLHVGPRLSEAAIHNGVVYLAGQVPEVNPDAGIAEQTREVLGHIDKLLAECGSDKANLLSVQIFLKDIKEIGKMNAIWDEWVAQGNTPPRATVQAELADPRWRIEILVVAKQIKPQQ